MKPRTRIDYAARIERVVERIAAAVGDEEMPSAEALAAVAALSPFHFHRVFRLMTGEPLGALIRRVRLARSLDALAEDDARVTDASGAAGYATSQAYARALRATIGTSATELRLTPAALSDVARRLASASGVAVTPVAIEVVSTAPLRLHVLRNVGAYAELNHGFEQLFERVFARVPMTALAGVHGLWEDDACSVDPDALRFGRAVELTMVAADTDVEALAVDGGPHLRARHVGDYESLLDAVDGLAAVAVSAGLALRDAPIRVHYVDTPDDAPPHALRSDIYVPLA